MERFAGMCSAAIALQAPQHVELENPYATANAEGIEILLNESGGRRMVFDEHDFSSNRG